MKHILESSETLQAYAVIDCCHYMLQNIQKNLAKPQSPINIMIDNATGFGKAQRNEFKTETIDLLEQIIEAKKTIEADWSIELEMLKKVNAIKEEDKL